MFTDYNINATSNFGKNSNSFLVYLIARIGATIAGVKPAELLNISIPGNRKEQWEECKKVLAINKNIGGLECLKRIICMKKVKPYKNFDGLTMCTGSF